MTTTIDLAAVPETAKAIIEGKVRGRVVVTVSG
jgi:hypothetical protein